ncbi:MAG: hypothetical protein KF802_15035 [Bdellovibrionaceae bacterium]|nr:hypothetical protein [Pseudobdellovibrionaceae bacterium]
MKNEFPPVFTETLMRPHGLVLFAGLRQSGVEETVRGLLAAANRRLGEDVVVMDGELGAAGLKKALTAAEEGRLVVLIQRAPTPLVALRRLLSEDFGEGRRHVLWRLSEQLLLMSGQLRLKGMNDGRAVDAFEILLMTPALRAALAQEDFSAADQALRSAADGAGLVNFNQAILQMLLRRQIDIKTAFEATRDPSHLDEILKQVGI